MHALDLGELRIGAEIDESAGRTSHGGNHLHAVYFEVTFDRVVNDVSGRILGDHLACRVHLHATLRDRCCAQQMTAVRGNDLPAPDFRQAVVGLLPGGHVVGHAVANRAEVFDRDSLPQFVGDETGDAADKTVRPGDDCDDDTKIVASGRLIFYVSEIGGLGELPNKTNAPASVIALANRRTISCWRALFS